MIEPGTLYSRYVTPTVGHHGFYYIWFTLGGDTAMMTLKYEFVGGRIGAILKQKFISLDEEFWPDVDVYR